ncbi:MAG: 1-(5-phosphoribosyl)-5-[(5-phosphoribosylamino)methylideneamino] imidazole-4-carboxamide isomerase [Chloroflexota bacterium]|nr:1-(5-phosphoribosyl)-5-[(5-phosphoribosylamino)methylideneamino] imidazole-4-carboxamide isomerase [Chloroflexota bacterium]
MVPVKRPIAPRPAFDLIPAIDLLGGRVVRLVTGDFSRETVYGDDPASVAEGFAGAGAGWLHLVDLDGARAGTPAQAEAVAAVVGAVGRRLRVQVGGGLRSDDAVDRVLHMGVARVVIGTAALSTPGFAGGLVRRYGSERVAAALDVRSGQAVGEGWRGGAAGVPPVHAAARLMDEGVETLIVTGIERDGLLEGPDVDLLERILRLGPGRVIASGGISSTEDVLRVRELGCSGAIVGRALYEGRLDLRATLEALAD